MDLAGVFSLKIFSSESGLESSIFIELFVIQSIVSIFWELKRNGKIKMKIESVFFIWNVCLKCFTTVNVKSCLNAFYIVLCVRFIYFFLRKARMKEARKAPLIKPIVPKIKINGNCPILLPFVKPASAPILAPTLAP